MNPTPRPRFATQSARGALASVALALAGCSICDPGAGMPEAAAPPSETVAAPQIPGFFIEAHEVGDAEQDEAFGRSLDRKGLVAIRVEVENQAGADLTLELSDAHVRTSARDELPILGRRETLDRLTHSRWRATLGLPMLIFPFFIYWGQITDCNHQLTKTMSQARDPAALVVRDGRSHRFYLFFRASGSQPRQLVVPSYRGPRDSRDDSTTLLELMLRESL